MIHKLYPTSIAAHLAVRPLVQIIRERFWSGRMSGKDVVSELRRGLVPYSRIERGPSSGPLRPAFKKALAFHMYQASCPSALE